MSKHENSSMNRLKKLLLIPVIVSLAINQLVSVFLASTWLYTTVNLKIAKMEGVYATPEDGMRVLVTESWIDVERVEIEYAGTNSFDGSNPHVWFVVAQVWAARVRRILPIRVLKRQETSYLMSIRCNALAMIPIRSQRRQFHKSALHLTPVA